jgi:hypothetical protein
MAHEVGKVLEVTLYETSDGSVFDTEELALNYESSADKSKGERETLQNQKNKLDSLSKSYSKVNGYYRMITGNFFGSNDILDGLTSMVLSTPKITLEMLTTIRDLEKEGLK